MADKGALRVYTELPLYSQHSNTLTYDKKRKYNAIGGLTMYTGIGLFFYFASKKA